MRALITGAGGFVGTHLVKHLAKRPRGAHVLNQIVNEQSINFGLEIVNPKKVYRFEIKRLPTQINPEKAKFKVSINVSESGLS